MGNEYGPRKGRPRAEVLRRFWRTSIRYARQSVTDITQGVLLRGAPQPTTHPSRFLAERSADSVDDTTPHNRDVFLGPSTPIVRGVMLSLDSGEKLQRHHRQRRGES